MKILLRIATVSSLASFVLCSPLSTHAGQAPPEQQTPELSAVARCMEQFSSVSAVAECVSLLPGSRLGQIVEGGAASLPSAVGAAVGLPGGTASQQAAAATVRLLGGAASDAAGVAAIVGGTASERAAATVGILGGAASDQATVAALVGGTAPERTAATVGLLGGTATDQATAAAWVSLGGGLVKGLFGGGDDEKALALQREQGRVGEIAAARAAAARTAFAAAAQSDAQRTELYRQLAEIVRSTGSMSGLSSRAQADVAKARLEAAQAQSMAARVRARAAYSNVNRDRDSTLDSESTPSAEDWLRSQLLGSVPKGESVEVPRTDGKPKGK